MAGDAPPTQWPRYRYITERLVRLNEQLLANDIIIYHYAAPAPLMASCI